MNEVQKARLTLAIDELNKKIEASKNDLSRTKSFNRAAWLEYGSELCAGDMERKEQDLTKQITELEKQLLILESFKGTEAKALKRLQEMEQEALKKIGQELNDLDEAKASHQRNLKNLDFVLETIGD